MAASSFNCTASATVKGDQLQDISALSFVLPVTNLKAKEDLMSTRAYKALNQEKYNQITFKLTDAVVSGKIVKATGNLTISGVTNPVTLQANYAVNGDEVVFKGSKAIKMSDFKVKAPSFMMGALKTGDEVIIDIALKLKN
jgi:polyisoprenoid-binding protein YceI